MEKVKKILKVIAIIFVAFIAIILLIPSPEDEKKEPETIEEVEPVEEETVEEEKAPAVDTEEIKSAISDTIGENEKINSVEMKDGVIVVNVDLSAIDPAPLTAEELALSRFGSITDAILKDDYYNQDWDGCVVDFGNLGKVSAKKSDAKTNDYGMRYFETPLKLEK